MAAANGAVGRRLAAAASAGASAGGGGNVAHETAETQLSYWAAQCCRGDLRLVPPPRAQYPSQVLHRDWNAGSTGSRGG